MFDIIGFWTAATVFCVPPFILFLWGCLCIANHQVEVESNKSLRIPLYEKVCSKLGEDTIMVVTLLPSIPALLLGITYLIVRTLKDQDLTLVKWISHCSEFWSVTFGWVFSIFAAFVVIKLLAKFYAKFVILSEKVKTL